VAIEPPCMTWFK